MVPSRCVVIQDILRERIQIYVRNDSAPILHHLLTIQNKYLNRLAHIAYAYILGIPYCFQIPYCAGYFGFPRSPHICRENSLPKIIAFTIYKRKHP